VNVKIGEHEGRRVLEELLSAWKGGGKKNFLEDG
jgi:hypothetical protein